MKYYKQYREAYAPVKEITKEEARQSLDGYWNEPFLEDIFNKEKAFRLYSPYAVVWTETDTGLPPLAGFYGVAE